MSGITVVIVTFDRLSSLRLCVNSVLSQSLLPEKIIIVDNAGNLCPDMFSCLHNINVQIIKGSRNSLTAGRNTGIAHSSTDYTLLLDDDVIIPPAYCETILSIIRSLSNDFAGGQFLLNSPGYNKFANIIRRFFFLFNREKDRAVVYKSIQSSYPSDISGKFVESEWLSGTNLFYKTSVLRKVLWDSKMTKYCEGEDIDHSFRIVKSGCRLFISNLQYVEHIIESASRLPTKNFYLMHEHYTFYLYHKLFADNLFPYLFSRLGNFLFDFYYDITTFDLSLHRCRYRIQAFCSTFLNRKDLKNGVLTNVNRLY